MPNWTRTISDTQVDKHLYQIAKQLERVAGAAALAYNASTTTTTTTTHA